MSRESPHASLSQVHASVSVPRTGSYLRRILAFAGPAYLVAVGYMDPGNWATDLAAGSGFRYSLLWVLAMSNAMAILLQGFASRLGIARGQDLAQACRTEYPPLVNLALYVLCELAITATDLAEVLGSAIALQLLFGLPLVWGVVLTGLDAFALLFLSHLGIRKLEGLILSLITVIGSSFLVELWLARPHWGAVAHGFIPTMPDARALFVSIGMLGATVMPHNLYLHSSLVQTRSVGKTDRDKRQAIRLNTLDSAVALNIAFLVNSAILIMAAAVFHRAGHREVAEIQDAHKLLSPLLGSAVAPMAFAIGLLASGQSSTITGTLAGQVVMEGFLRLRISPWIRRLITRMLAIVPAIAVIMVSGDRSAGNLLVLSQVLLSLQLPFAIIPLIHFVSDRDTMGSLVAPRPLRIVAWICAAIVLALNLALVADVLRGWLWPSGTLSLTALLLLVPASGLLGALLVYVTIKPWLERWIRVRRGKMEKSVHAMPTDAALEAPSTPLSTVAVALDFSGRERQILAETLRFLGAQRPHLALMHVTESAGARFLGADVGDSETDDDAAQLESHAARLRELGFDVSTHLSAGRPVPALVRLIETVEPDLVVLGAHGHRLLSDIIFGSTADALRHRIKASVLVVGRSR